MDTKKASGIEKSSSPVDDLLFGEVEPASSVPQESAGAVEPAAVPQEAAGGAGRGVEESAKVCILS